MSLFFKGKLDGKRISTYQGKERCQLQFVQDRGDGSLSFLEIKVPDGVNHTQYQQGKLVEFPVEYSVVEGEVYFRIAKQAAGMSGRPEQ